MSANELLLKNELVSELPHKTGNQIASLLEAAVGEGTLEGLFENETLLKASTTDGQLTKPQRAAVTASASLMQDKIIRLMEGMVRILHEQTVRSDYLLLQEKQRSPVVQFLSSEMFHKGSKRIEDGGEDLEEDPAEGLITKTPPKSLLTWGNFLAAGAILLVAIAAIVTSAYANYKDLAESRLVTIGERDKEIADLTKDLAKAEGIAVAASTRADLAEGRAAFLEDQQKRSESLASGGAEGLNDEIKRLNEELKKIVAKEAEYRTKYESTNKEFQSYKGSYNTIYKRMTDAEKKVQALSTMLAERGVYTSEYNSSSTGRSTNTGG